MGARLIVAILLASTCLLGTTRAECVECQTEGSSFYTNLNTSFCPQLASVTYRTFDGTCNHVRNRGAALTTFSRLLPPDYSDGNGAPRRLGEDGKPLASPRKISLRVHPDRDVPDHFTQLLMAWGQYIDHDMASNLLASDFDHITIRCCEPDGQVKNNSHPDCFPIILTSEENFFEGTCMEFHRSMGANDSSGNPMCPRQQMNRATAFIDASHVYGTKLEAVTALRKPGGYHLRTGKPGFLPEQPHGLCIKRNGTDDYCFLSGDHRVNQQVYLAGLHTVWHRAHNMLADELRAVKKHASNETIFQEARRLVIALNQHVQYNEWLPIILGEEAVTRWGLSSKHGRGFYNPGLDPGIINSFTTAAFRFGHSLVPANFLIGNKSVPLRYLFARAPLLLDHFDDVITGMVGNSHIAGETIQAMDKNFVEDISNFLFRDKENKTSFDLIAINIQRGRDHGLPRYVQWRSFCGERPLTGFNDTDALGPNVGELASVYSSVNDIDLFTGLVFEPVKKGLVGPTLQCLIRTQFYNLKYGDRYFFDTDLPGIAFTDAQLAWIRSKRLSHVMCLVSGLEKVARDVFRFSSNCNPRVQCSKLRQEMQDLSVFADVP